MACDDIFLKVDGCKGNSSDAAHAGEIDVLSWSWGMQGNLDAHEGKSGRSTVHEFECQKRVDTASTGLMSALRNNTPVPKAVLTVREAGGTNPNEYLKVTMEKARITSFRAETRQTADGPATVETVRFGFQKIRFEYKDQASTGGSKGTSTFETSIEPGS